MSDLLFYIKAMNAESVHTLHRSCPTTERVAKETGLDATDPSLVYFAPDYTSVVRRFFASAKTYIVLKTRRATIKVAPTISI